MRSNSIQFNQGYSLLEVVITIVVIGILSAVVVPSFKATSQHSVTTQADDLRRNLSHIQFMSISQGQRLRLSVNSSGSKYTVESCSDAACSSTTAVIDPVTKQNFSVNMTDGVKLTPVNSTLLFDSIGRPQDAGGLISSIPAKTYMLSVTGRSVTVTVQPITGFAETHY